MENSDEHFMQLALNEAMDAYESNEVPIGSVVVLDGRIIARGHNMTEVLHDVTAHAEMIAITAGSSALGAKYLRKCTLYVTLEPCIMCAGAIMHSQIERLVYGASDPKKGYTLLHSDFMPKNLKITKGVLEDACGQILRDFFKDKR